MIGRKRQNCNKNPVHRGGGINFLNWGNRGNWGWVSVKRGKNFRLPNCAGIAWGICIICVFVFKTKAGRGGMGLKFSLFFKKEPPNPGLYRGVPTGKKIFA